MSELGDAITRKYADEKEELRKKLIEEITDYFDVYSSQHQNEVGEGLVNIINKIFGVKE